MSASNAEELERVRKFLGLASQDVVVATDQLGEDASTDNVNLALGYLDDAKRALLHALVWLDLAGPPEAERGFREVQPADVFTRSGSLKRKARHDEARQGKAARGTQTQGGRP